MSKKLLIEKVHLFSFFFFTTRIIWEMHVMQISV